MDLAKLNELLSCISFKASLEGDHIVLTDLQGANLGGIEQETFDSIDNVIDRLEQYFEDTFLDGDVCCGVDYNFDDYTEAINTCKERGYIGMVDMINLYLSFQYLDCEPVGVSQVYPYNLCIFDINEDHIDCAYSLADGAFKGFERTPIDMDNESFVKDGFTIKLDEVVRVGSPWLPGWQKCTKIA